MSTTASPAGASRWRVVAALPAAIASLTLVSVAGAHDFWLIPNALTFAPESTVQVNGKSGVRFPWGSAVQPERVAEAWIIGASGRTRITELSVEENALRLRQKPGAAGQYRVAVALTPRTTRSTPAGLLRFLRLEGGGTEAARLERENAFGGQDSAIYQGASYAATLVQVGRGGPPASSTSAGFPLEFVPVRDPARLQVGDTLRVKVVGGGAPVPGIGLDATPAMDSVASAAGAEPQNTWVTLSADANGIVHLPLTKSGPWLLRSAFVRRRAGGAANEWDVARSTYVFTVGLR